MNRLQKHADDEGTLPVKNIIIAGKINFQAMGQKVVEDLQTLSRKKLRHTEFFGDGDSKSHAVQVYSFGNDGMPEL